MYEMALRMLPLHFFCLRSPCSLPQFHANAPAVFSDNLRLFTHFDRFPFILCNFPDPDVVVKGSYRKPRAILRRSA